MVDFLGLIVALGVIAATVYWYLFMKTGSEKGDASKDPSAAADKPPVKEEAAEPTTNNKKKNNQSSKGKGGKDQPYSKKKHKKAASITTKKKSKVPTDPHYVRRFGGHSGSITAMSVSPNGEWMATAGTEGLVRVAQVEKGSTLHLQTKVENPGMGIFQDHVSCLSWCGDNRTLICSIKQSRDLAAYRIRKKKDAAENDKFPYELIELVKRRFSTKSKDMDDIDTLLVDQAHAKFLLVVTSSRLMDHGNVVAWDGNTGQAVGTLTVPGGIRMSPDGRFLCGRVEGAASQVKLFEVHRKKVKGEVEPIFDKIPSKSVMTLVSKNSGKVVDIAFLGNGGVPGGGEAAVEGLNQCKRAVVGCEDGTVQIWDLDVEYRLREDPKLLCSMNLLNKPIKVMAAGGGDNNNRFAVATDDGNLHIFSITPEPSLSLDITIEDTHADGIGDIQFCPSSEFLFTRGSFSKDVFAWTIK